MFKISKSAIYNFSFILVFPCCFFYFFLVSSGVIPPFLGGYFGLVVAILFLPLLTLDLLLLRRNNKQTISFELLFYFFILYYFVVVILNFIFSKLESQSLVNHAANLLYFVTIYLIFKNIDVTSRVFYRANTFCVMLLLFLAAMQIKGGVFLLVVEGAGLSGDHASYQIIAVIYLLCILFYLAGEENTFKRFLMVVFSIVFLFVNGARSEFVAFILMIPILEFLKSNNRILVVALIIIGFILLSFLLWIASIEFSDSNNRVISLLVNTTDSSSSLEREHLLSAGWLIISKYPIIGGLSEYAPNQYIHNVLSVWLDLGAIGALYYFFLILVPPIYVTKLVLFSRNQTRLVIMIACLSGMALFLLIVAKTFYYLLVPAYLGLFSNLLRQSNVKRYSRYSIN